MSTVAKAKVTELSAKAKVSDVVAKAKVAGAVTTACRHLCFCRGRHDFGRKGKSDRGVRKGKSDQRRKGKTDVVALAKVA